MKALSHWMEKLIAAPRCAGPTEVWQATSRVGAGGPHSIWSLHRASFFGEHLASELLTFRGAEGAAPKKSRSHGAEGAAPKKSTLAAPKAPRRKIAKKVPFLSPLLLAQ